MLKLSFPILSDHLFYGYLQATPSLLYIYDHIEDKNIYANRSIAEILGYSYPEIKAMGSDLFTTICHPEDLPKLYGAIQKIRNLEIDEIVEIEYRVRDAQGEWHWLVSRDLVFSRTEDGQVWQTLGTSQDISDRKQAEIEIHRTQTFLDSIIENIPNMVFVKDAVDLKFVRLNKAAEDLLGYAKEDLLGKSDYDFFPSEEANFFMFKDREVLAKGEVMDIPEEKIHTNTQGIRILHTKKIPILNESNQPEYLLGISEDITERIQLENRLTRLARHIPGMIYQFRMRADGTSHFPYVSEGIRHIYGVAPLEVREDASAIFAVLHPDDLERIGQSIQDSATNLSPWHCEYRVHFADGRMIWVLGYATPQREADGSTIWHGYITDISDRKQAEFLLISEKERAEEAELKLQKTQIILERTNQKLLKLIDTDPLTKIANRRCFNIRVRQEWKRLFREQKFLSLILIDVDYFKYYNDRYGHPQGDRCLIQIAQTAKQTIGRSTDLVARIGGEEFAVILPNTDLEGAKVAAEKIRLAIQSLAIPHQDSQVNDKVTISLGIMSLIPTTGQSPTTLINQADQALFQAKKQGRNQSVIFCEILGYNENR